MSEIRNTTSAIKKPVAWTKRHQVAIAIVGAVLSTASYFGKDYAQEHWKGLAAGIKAAAANDDTIENTASLDQRLSSLLNDVDTLTKDALAVEQNKKPHAQSDRLDSTRGASLSSRNGQVNIILRKSQMRLRSLAALDTAANPSSPHRDELKAMRDDVDKKLSTTFKTAIEYLSEDTELFGPKSVQPRASEQWAENERMDKLEKQTDAIEQRTADLAVAIREEADRQRERCNRYAEWTSLVLSTIFVIGLLLSLIGKLTEGGGETSPSE